MPKDQSQSCTSKHQLGQNAEPLNIFKREDCKCDASPVLQLHNGFAQLGQTTPPVNSVDKACIAMKRAISTVVTDNIE